MHFLQLSIKIDCVHKKLLYLGFFGDTIVLKQCSIFAKPQAPFCEETEIFMNSDLGFDNGFEIYRKAMKNDAKKIFSRFNLGLFAYTAIAYLVTLVVEVVLLLALGEKFNDLLSNVYFVSLLGFAPMYVFGLPTLCLIVWKMPKQRPQKSKISFADFLIIFAVSQALMSVGNLIGNGLNVVISGIINKEISNATSDLIEGMPYWLIILLVVIIAPLVEEFIFRKLMIDRLSPCGSVAAIAVSSLVFALSHGNLYQFFYAAMMGAVLGYVYVKSGRFIYCFILHALINFFGSVAILPLIDMSEELTVFYEMLASGQEIDVSRFMICSMAVSSYTIINYVIVGAGIFLLVRGFMHKKIKVNSNPAINIHGADCASAAIFNVGSILYLAASLITIVASLFII